ncbi:DegT/DnrJ/EryC1/StrS family aminotransferase [Aporhodopirellula aestuarii]|uniref:DegT/DnrJ/EryC1/StrS family aminotransferase n=1 Tax=Aporhodopirellula aestuarii TaxID=2950107 RepID=A0ABT0UC11_9BACT|nr:DegT/DnrJ/EryC1/StrS family aminotransferase [Aporhodopirellula aestuarii]MCM2374401.1 DegT/DnrJ/EryC1/StrS family aminotransferase [Aporhodopirellula aestuarii]
MSDNNPLELPRDDDGWPTWPLQSQAIFDSIQRVWASGEWGHYQSTIHDECVAAVTRAMSAQFAAESPIPSPWISFGERVGRQPDVRLCSSGSVAIELALRACGITAGDEVVVAAYDYPGNFRTIELLGATPVLVDVRSGGVTIDPESLSRISGDSVKAVVVSHLYGELADVIAIREICDQRNWMLIEDACQVPGAGWCSGAHTDHAPPPTFIPVGAVADIATLSFGGSKLLSAGNGGAVVTRDDRLSARLRAYGDRPSDACAFSALQCAALIPQLEMLDLLNHHRAHMAGRLRAWDWSSCNAAPIGHIADDQRPAFYKFALIAGDGQERSELLSRLRRIGLPVGEGFRGMHATSDRRSRKPVPLDCSRDLSERCVVIDHRALLADDLIERLDSVAG